MNEQPIEKSVDSPESIDVHSIFYTIQGEGPFCGEPSVFVRLGGCNLRCPGCDTEYSQGRQMMTPKEVVDRVVSLSPRKGLVVITGGEPFRQNLTKLFDALVFAKYYVQVETNGTLPPSEHHYSFNPYHQSGVYIVCSPKTGRINPEILKKACCLKYVMRAEEMFEGDGLPLFALGHTANPYLARPPEEWDMPIFLQPMDEQDPEKNRRNIEAVTQACLKFGYRLQLQIHKFIGVA